MTGENSDTYFERTVKAIEQKYSELEFELGWRFLYSPASTLSSNSKIMFVGLNPGGNSFERPVPSVEKGNAFRVETWPGNGPAHQREVCRLFQLLAASIGRTSDSEDFMDEVLTTNFCPFRSPSWEALRHKEEAIRFSHSLWSGLWRELQPSVVICNGGQTFEYFRKVLHSAGASSTRSHTIATGWGEVKYGIEEFGLEDSGVAIVKLPHLSRFKTMSSDLCQSGRSALVNRLARYLAVAPESWSDGATAVASGSPAPKSSMAPRSITVKAPVTVAADPVEGLYPLLPSKFEVLVEAPAKGNMFDLIIRYQGKSIGEYERSLPKNLDRKLTEIYNARDYLLAKYNEHGYFYVRWRGKQVRGKVLLTSTARDGKDIGLIPEDCWKNTSIRIWAPK